MRTIVQVFKNIPYIAIFIRLGYMAVPITTAILFWDSDKMPHHIFFLCFMMFHAFERVWETFYTTKEKRVGELHGDWTLVIVTLAYIALCFVVIFECFIWSLSFSMGMSVMGLILYAVAFYLRWWGMKSLGEQWAIHAIGVQKIKKVRLLRVGPYKYIRHPIYLAIMFELISLPLIASAKIALLLAVTINVPLQYVRLKFEEKASARRFGDSYSKYKTEVSELLPIKAIINKLSQPRVSR